MGLPADPNDICSLFFIKTAHNLVSKISVMFCYPS